jgi:hypothetical protein
MCRFKYEECRKQDMKKRLQGRIGQTFFGGKKKYEEKEEVWGGK